jgi:hypothetical protein
MGEATTGIEGGTNGTGARMDEGIVPLLSAILKLKAAMRKRGPAVGPPPPV